jgi:alkaline phosphatase
VLSRPGKFHNPQFAIRNPQFAILPLRYNSTAMSKIFTRLLLTLVVIAIVAAAVIRVMKMIPPHQRYPIAGADISLVPSAPQLDGVPEGVARNVILILGDGMGTSAIEAARLTSVGPSGRLEMQKLPVKGMVSTRSADSLVTDSAAAATAIATGVKTNIGMLGVDPEGKPLRTILEAAKASGFVTGVVTTFDASDATPAAFVAHSRSRRDRPEIAAQIVRAGIDIVMGSGVKHFAPVSLDGGRRGDGIDLLAEATSSGATVVRDLKALREAARLPVLGLFGEKSARPPLPDLAHESLRLVEAAGKRFFLVIESEETDSAAHDNDLGRTLSAVREVDQTVRTVVDWARRDGATLVIVTADHDTGGLQIIPSESPKLLQVVWSTRRHTAQDVALYAFGPGAESFAGHFDNTDLAPIMARLLGIESAMRE